MKLRQQLSSLAGCSLQEGEKQPLLESVLVIEKFGMPLHAQQEGMTECLNGFNHSIWGDRAHDQGRRYTLDRLVMGTVHPKRSLTPDPPEEATWADPYRMAYLRSWSRLIMGKRRGDLPGYILEQTPSQSHVEGLHPTANTQQRDPLAGGHPGYVKLELIPARIHHFEGKPLSLPVQSGRQVWSTSGQQQSVHPPEELTPDTGIGG